MIKKCDDDLRELLVEADQLIMEGRECREELARLFQLKRKR